MTIPAAARERPYLVPGLAFLVTGAAFVVLARISWLRWADPMVDFGRELYYPWRILHGEVLRRDLTQVYGPLSDYLNALWMFLGGESVHTLFVANFILAVYAIAWILYLFGTWLGWLAGVLAALGFMVMGVFSFANAGQSFNFIAPYSHAATHGFIGALTVVALGLDFIRRGGVVRLYAAALVTGLVFLTKPEPFFALTVAAAALYLAILLGHPERRRVCHRHAGGLLLLFLLPFICFFIYFLLYLPANQALAAAGGAWTFLVSDYVVHSHFQYTLAGFDAPLRNLTLGAFSAAMQLCWLGAAYWVVAGGKKSSRLAWPVLVLAVALPLPRLIRADLITFSHIVIPHGAMVLSWLILVLSLYVHRSASSSPRERDAALFLGVWSLFSLALLARKWLDTTLFGYGFVLVTPALLGCIGVLAGLMPLRLRARSRPTAAVTLQAVYTAFILLVFVGTWRYAHGVYPLMTHAIGQGRDRIMALPPTVDPRSSVHERFDLWARQWLRPDDTLLVMPEGLIVNFLYRIPNPARVHSFLPTDFAWQGESRLIEELRRARPRYVLFWFRPMAEYGQPFFGAPGGGGAGMLAWLRQEYSPVYHMEDGFSLDRPDKKGMIVLRIKDAANMPAAR
ncbi:MAG: hypothetical protein HQL66_02860 [Magnetococcales bacterium]|nr:hypothetical protein [Magnetococcales bacterium]